MRMGTWRRCTLGAAAALALTAGVDQAAATTTVEQSAPGGPVTLVGDADGTNTTITNWSPVVFSGVDLALGAGSTCTQSSSPGATPVQIWCWTSDVTANLGDGDDVLDLGPTPAVVNAGAGNDRITGSDGSDVLNGGPGRDGIDARGGDDLLDGGPGDDWLDGGTGADDFLGGDGEDVITSRDLFSDITDQDGYADCGDGMDLVAITSTSAPLNCEKQLPYYVSKTGATLTHDPVAGTQPSVRGLSAALTIAPDNVDVDWYLCSGPVETRNANGGLNPACSPMLDRLLPADSAGKFLGAVVYPVAVVGAGRLTSRNGWTSVVARQILATAPPKPPVACSPVPFPGRPRCPTAPAPAPPADVVARCKVPKLIGLTRARAIAALHKGHCGTGKIMTPTKRRKGNVLKVGTQGAKAGSSRPADTEISFRLRYPKHT